MIDIVALVYRSLAATRRCIESVLAAPCAEPHEVIVIDDARPEPAHTALAIPPAPHEARR